MGKIIAMMGILGGIAYLLYVWILRQKEQNHRITEIIVFLQKLVFVMEEDNIGIIEYLSNYRSRDSLLTEILTEVAHRLALRVYPDGWQVWEDVLTDRKEEFRLDEETWDLVLGIGRGIFGKRRGENLCFLNRDICRLEERQKQKREQDAKERKVWIPVGMLGGVMLMIILI